MKKSSMVVVSALAGSAVLATTANAQATNCNALPNPVYIAGGTSVTAYVEAVAVALQNAGVNATLIYQGVDGCIGLNDLVTDVAEPFAPSVFATTLGTDGGFQTPGTCDPTNGGTTAGLYPDIAVSPASPASCNAYAGVPTLGGNEKDWSPTSGVISAYAFAVLKASTAASISAEAAYTVFGWSGQQHQVQPWTDPTQMFIRAPTSGAELMLGIGIGLAPAKWLATSPVDGGTAQQYSSSSKLVAALEASTNPAAAIGILSTQYVDQSAGALKTLPFQARESNGDQMCGYLPDSDATHFDKINVRQGRYGLWGNIHFVTYTSGGNAVPNPKNSGSGPVAQVLKYLTEDSSLSTSQTQSLIVAAKEAYAIPACAMEVTRNADLGPEASYQPKGACGCFYESLFGATVSPYCKTCTSGSCSGTYGTCNYGYCEAQ